MADTTQIIRIKADTFFDAVDGKLGQVLDSKSSRAVEEFLKEYMEAYPTLGSYVYEHLYQTNPKLRDMYTDYTLSERKPGVTGAEVIDDCAKYYNEKIIKPTLKEKGMAKAVCSDPDLARFLANWRNHLEKKGYAFMGRADAAENVRNTVFHLAVGLGMDLNCVTRILTKCLLMADFNPKDHKEVIFFWCIKHNIPFTRMMEDYVRYYDALDIADLQKNYRLQPLPEGHTLDLLDQMEAFADENSLKAHLSRIKLSEDVKKTRKTPQEVYWDNFICFPVQVYKPERETGDASEQELWLEKKLPEDAEFPERDPNRGEIQERAIDLERRLKVLEQSRKYCLEANSEILPNTELLKKLFDGIHYSINDVFKHKTGETFISRNEMLATMFIGFFSDVEFVKNRKQMTRREREDFFEQMISDELFCCGLHTFYERNPFELFLLECFFHEDPLAYFFACWETALSNGK